MNPPFDASKTLRPPPLSPNRLLTRATLLMDRLPPVVEALLSQHLGEPSLDRPLKKRRRRAPGDEPEPAAATTELEAQRDPLRPMALTSALKVPVDSTPSGSSPSPNFQKPVTSGDSSDDYSLDDFEDVFPESLGSTVPSAIALVPVQPSAINITFAKPHPKPPKARVVSREERQRRKGIHCMYVVAMVGYGRLRSKWCSNPSLQRVLRPLVSSETMKQLFPDKTLSPSMRSRKFLDALLLLARMWGKRFRVSSNGIVRKEWGGLGERQPQTDGDMSLFKFAHLISSFQGSRDLGTQGFVALLRSVGLNCRLVYSLQPPDFTNVKVIPPPESPQASLPGGSARTMRLLMRGPGAQGGASRLPPKSSIPLMWVEVWNRHTKHWVTIDPVVLVFLETVKVNSRLEPSAAELASNTLSYVVAFDRAGGVRDVTPRYSLRYNAKTRKKRVTKTHAGQEWYATVLDEFSSLSRRETTQIDLFEQQEFAKRSLQEGMPNSVQDFRGHPVYVLESHLKANEIIFPMKPCGTLRLKGKNSGRFGEVILVYKRENVRVVRSAKAWYMQGRLLRMGEQSLKVRETPNRRPTGLGSDRETEVGLYAEYQTELYIPLPVTADGKVPKNKFGSLDVYTPTMVPEGGVLVRTKHAPEAARIMGIDYASATVGFDFSQRRVTAKTGGIVIALQFLEALTLIQEHLEEDEVVGEQKRLEMVALGRWNLILTKLRIAHRLNITHGLVQQIEAKEASVATAGKNEDQVSGSPDDYGLGDFHNFMADYDEGEHHSISNSEGENLSHGFSLGMNLVGGSPEGGPVEGGGFIVEDPTEGGGFIVEDEGVLDIVGGEAEETQAFKSHPRSHQLVRSPSAEGLGTHPAMIAGDYLTSFRGVTPQRGLRSAATSPIEKWNPSSSKPLFSQGSSILNDHHMQANPESEPQSPACLSSALSSSHCTIHAALDNLQSGLVVDEFEFEYSDSE